MKKISICVPCYNEKENIELMYNSILEQISKKSEYSYEIIFADNCSIDGSQKVLRELAKRDKRVKVILNQSNVGPDRSCVNMACHVTGDACISLPCDFQDPPSLIPEFINTWEKGYDVVWGQKQSSKENKIKFSLRKIYYSIIAILSDFPQLRNVTGFGLMDKRVLDIVLVTQLQDPEFSTRHLIMQYGFSIKLIPYTQAERKRGKSSYNIYRYYNFAITSLCNTSVKPLHVITFLGAIISIISFLISLFYLVYKVFNWNSFSLGIAPLIVGIFFFSGIQLFSIGVIGEYISVIIRRVTKGQIAIEKELLNFEEEPTEE